MKKNKINNIIFSSTASIYKKNLKMINENSELKPLSHYAKTKLNAEKLIRNNSELKHVILRFFNVCSALSKPVLGELHNPETHLIPTVVYKSLKKKNIYIYGRNFDTFDGTCVRDYIHVEDICSAIEKSFKFLLKKQKSLILNIGNSKGYSNLEIINFIEKKIKRKSKIIFTKKRKGDVSTLICDSNKAQSLISWKPTNSKINKR